MKNYEEISKNVLKRRDEYKEKKRIKRQTIIQISTAVVCLVVITVTYFAAVRRNWLKTQIAGLLEFQASLSAPYVSQTDIDNTTKVQSTMPTTPPTQSTTFPYVTTTEISTEIDWNRKSMPGKFNILAIKGAQHLSTIDMPETVGGCVERSYAYPFESSSETSTTRPATLLLTDKYIAGLEPNGTRHTTLVDVFSLEGFSEELVLGVSFPDDDRIYAYVSSSYIPETLGEFLEAIDYDNTVTYGGIMLYPGNNFPVNEQNAQDIKSFLLWDSSCVNIMDANAEATGQCVTVSISCHELGRESKTLKIYEDGHITTNLIGYEYTFYVGETAVTNFLKHSYNITFEEIKAQTTVPTTGPTTAVSTTEPITESVASSVATPIDENTEYNITASVTEPIADTVTVTDSAAFTTTDPNDPMWWCGTEME